jgi:hypothetical protein
VADSFGTRRTETTMLDVADFGRNPDGPECGEYGVLYVRHGKAKRAPLRVDGVARPEVMHEAVRVGASMINDVRALQMPGALGAAAELEVPVCLMHMQGEPRTMQRSPHITMSSRRSSASSPTGCAPPSWPA